MKKLLMIMTVVALTMVFLPKAEAEDTARLSLVVEFEEPYIAIEFKPGAWELKNLPLGVLVENVDENGSTIHSLKNTGNVGVMVEVRYVGTSLPLSDPRVLPGSEAGVDRFAIEMRTEQAGGVIPPEGKIIIGENIAAQSYIPVKMTYYAPTKLTPGITRAHVVHYDFRAYPAE